MDPNANLLEQLEISKRLLELSDSRDMSPVMAEMVDLSARLAELVETLNNWIVRGGFLPTEWRRANPLRGMRVLGTYAGNGNQAVYLEIPRELRAPTGGCNCDYCKAHPEIEPTWDVLGVPLIWDSKHSAYPHTWTVHMPEMRSKLMTEIPDIQKGKKK